MVIFKFQYIFHTVCFLRVILQLLKLNSRILTIIGVMMSLIACAIIADWQSIPHDHCTRYSLFHHPNLVEHYGIKNVTAVNSRIYTHSHPFELEASDSINTVKDGKDIALETAQVQVLQVVDNSVYYVAVNACESANKYDCHWIPNSLITKKHCDDCQPICRSVYRTLNFVQFTIGAVLFIISMPIARVSVTAVISASVSKSSQVHSDLHVHFNYLAALTTLCTFLSGHCHGGNSSILLSYKSYWSIMA